MASKRIKSLKTAVLGDGAWGTAVALVLCSNGYSVNLWGAFQNNIDAIRRDAENRQFLPGVKIPAGISATADMKSAVQDAELIVLASPSQYMRGTLEKLKPYYNPEKQVLLDISKGIENGTLLRMSELVESILGDSKYVVLSGPSHAEEVALKIPTAVVAASKDMKLARFVQNAMMNDRFRVYTTKDVVGVELGGALKNVYAIAAGIIDGLGLGDNPKAALMTRGIAEMARIGRVLGGQRRTFSGLSGIGDLIVTCMSRHSRNRYVGEELGKGRKLDEIIRSMNMVVAEGVKTCEAAKALASKMKIEAPIIYGVYRIIHDGCDPHGIAFELMTRKARPEYDEE